MYGSRPPKKPLTEVEQQVIKMLGDGSPLDKARQVFGAQYGKMEQAYMQQRPPDAISMRRMEFEAVAAIINAYVDGKTRLDGKQLTLPWQRQLQEIGK